MKGEEGKSEMTVSEPKTVPCNNPKMVPLTDLAEINPARSLGQLSPEADVSFVPMGDTTESGRWINKQTRK